jgi:predicted signal transduction protein with EAL and GGDEF domain
VTRIQCNLEEAGIVPVTLSIGIGVLDDNRPSAPDLLQAADRALYHVKRTGRSGIAATDADEPNRVAETDGLCVIRPPRSNVDHKVS